MKARLLIPFQGHAAGAVIDGAQPGTGPGMIPQKYAEWFNEGDDVKPVSERTAKAAVNAALKAKK